MKVIDLIYKIANGEEVPQKIIYEDELYEYREDLHDYENKYPDFEAGTKYKYLFEDPYGRDYKDFFNDEVELTEEDKKIKDLQGRLNNIINEINSIVEYWGYDKEQNDISSFRMAMKSIKDILGSDKEWKVKI